jgi:hypothetical protein
VSVVTFTIVNGSTYYDPLGNAGEMALQSAPKVSRVQRNGDDALVLVSAEELVTEHDIRLPSRMSALLIRRVLSDRHPRTNLLWAYSLLTPIFFRAGLSLSVL